ncbi:hypothetical protein PVL29_001037 [Vitis rotundifolia]|uniref:Uncharacterized protein n=1 Tax=Vitis rotundifolia TaxID=103349 RepID=A0AA39ALT2_VITRO|nr:hypothetical protein PVL29_001037 [Vitis rotundifolia]
MARIIATKEQRLEVARTSGSKQKTPEVAKSSANKGKRATIDQNVELAQRFNLHFANRTMIPSRNIDFSKFSYFQFDRLFKRMGWLPIMFVKEFLYPRRLYGCQKGGRPTSHLLTVLSRILQYMIFYNFIPKGGHRDDVPFLEAFLIDSILIERKINMGNIIFRHMKACLLREDSVLPYGMFITKIAKYFNVNLRNKTDSKKLKSFDTYDQASLRHMHFVCKKDAGRDTENENVTAIPLNDDVEAKAVADHPSQIARNEAEASNNLNA